MKFHLPIRLFQSLLACLSVVSLTLSSGNAMAEEQASLILGEQETLTIDYADADTLLHADGVLQLMGGTQLNLSNCGEGDGKTYTLATGVSSLLDAEGNELVLDSGNNAISLYFDTTQPGVGFWADATLSLTEDGTLQLVRHHETVKASQTITTRQTETLVYNYYEGISFVDIDYTDAYSAYGGAFDGRSHSTITLSGNGSVELCRNIASVSYSGNDEIPGIWANGGAVYGCCSISGNANVRFDNNSARASISSSRKDMESFTQASGGAISGNTVELRDNGSVEICENTVSTSNSVYRAYSYGGAIYGGSSSTIELSDNGSVTFSGNTASSSSYSYADACGGAIYGGDDSTITLSGNGSVEFNGNKASSDYSAYGGAIYGDNIMLSENKEVSFVGNLAHLSNEIPSPEIPSPILLDCLVVGYGDVYKTSCGGAIYGAEYSTITLDGNGSVTFIGNTASVAPSNSIAYGGAIYGGENSTIELSDNGSVTFSGNTAEASSYGNACGGAIYGGSNSTITLNGNGSVTFIGNTASSPLDGWASGGAIYGSGSSTITLSNNGSVTFSGNEASEGGAIYGGGYWSESTITLSNNGSVTFSGNIANHGGAIYGEENSTITLSGNESVEFIGNSAFWGGAVGSYSIVEIAENDVVIFDGNEAEFWGGAIGYHNGAVGLIRDNGRVCFSNNNVVQGSGGAILVESRSLITLSGNDSVEFSGNTASSSYSYAYVCGGAICGWDSTITLSNNGSVTFSGNTASSSSSSSSSSYAYGGAIYGGNSSTITLSNNGSVEFSGNTASSSSSSYAYGGAIYGGSNSTITLSGNESVTFSGNIAFYGGAIYSSSVEIIENDVVIFDGNEAEYGGAILFHSDFGMKLSDNGSVTFRENVASFSGGAIYGEGNSPITLRGNESVEFSGNSAFLGGAVGSYSIVEIAENDVVIFDGNEAEYWGGAIWFHPGAYFPSLLIRDNSIVRFSDNSAGADGGAIYGVGTIELSGNVNVEFRGNVARHGGAISFESGNLEISENDVVIFDGNEAEYGGGAIDCHYGAGAILIRDNGNVSFSNNVVNASDGAFNAGGAIYSNRNLSIQNNASVLFEKNAEVDNGKYRLRSIFAGGSGDVISLSAAGGKSIEFRDSVYVASGSTVELNADYTDADGKVHKQTGDIIFTGAYTEQHLNELLADAEAGRTATAEEILNSRTTEVQAMTNLYGGRLRVEDGAIYKGHGITVHEGSAATVLVKDATLDHAGYDLVFHSGTSLELVGDNAVTANRLQMHTGSKLIFRENAGLMLDGTLNVQGEGTLLLENGNLSAQKIDGTGGISITGGRLELQDDTDALAVDGAVSISNTNLSGNWCGEGLTVDGVSVAADAEISLKNLTLKSVLSNEGTLVLGGEISMASEDFGSVGGDVQYSAGASGYRYTGHSFTLVEGSGQSTAEAESKWRITENGTNRDYQSYSYANGVLTAYIERDITTYWVNDAVTYDGRNEFDTAETLVLNGGKLTLDRKLGSNLTGGIRVDAASTLSLSSGVEVKRAQLSGVTESNTVSLAGAGKLNLGSSADFTGYALNKDWRGTVKLENITTDTNLDMNTIGQIGSTIELENVMGYTGVNGGTVAADLQLNRSKAADGTEQAALVISNGYSHKTNADHVMTTFSGTVSGYGKMVYEKTLSNPYTGFAFSGDVSGWKGAFEMNGGKTFNLVFNGKATEINANISDISSNGTLNLRLGANGAMRVNGTVDVDSIIVTNNQTVSFSNTVNTGSLSAVGSSLSFDAAAVVSGDMSAAALTLGTSGSLNVDGTLSTELITMKHLSQTAPALTVGQFAAGDTIFSLSRENLDSLNLAHGESVVIAHADNAISQDFRAWVAEGSSSIDAVVYRYDLSVSGADVMVSKDYANWGTRVWYGNEWVGKESWKDYMAAGYDAVNGVEALNLGGAVIEAENLIIAPGDSAAVTGLSNGDMSVSYTEVADGKLRIAEDTVLETVELAAEGRDIELQGELIVTDGQIGTLSGTTGDLTIDGELSVDSNVTLGSLDNAGSLDIGKHKLNVAGALTNGGNVIAGEVVAHNRTRNFAEFDTLVADRVTVTNTSTSASYTDNISVGDGSAIGELVAETLEVREGTVTLGRTDGETTISLLNLDLQDDAALVLNQQTALSVTGELSATEDAELQLKKLASVSYGEMHISNGGAANTVRVNAYELANGSISELSHAHVELSSSEDTTIDYKLTNSSVENTGSGKLYVTHEENTLSAVHAASGDITVMNQALGLNLDELVVGNGATFSAYSGEVELPEQETVVSVSESVVFGAGAHINADLKLQSGVKVEMNGPVSMGSDLYLFTGMTLGGAMLESLTSANQGQTVVLFSGIDRLYLCGEERTDAIALSHGVSASEYFVNLISSAERGYYLVYDNAEVGNGVLSVTVSGMAVPEPTTSLLGLMGLVAFTLRRRRK